MEIARGTDVDGAWYVVFSLGLLATLLLGFVSGGIFVMQMSGVVKNITTVEMNYTLPNPYDLGWRENVRQLFGPLSVAWFLPLQLKTPACDGYRYSVDFVVVAKMQENSRKVKTKMRHADAPPSITAALTHQSTSIISSA
eukprot:CAMPEP_0113847660 /NCGR_PEP_ID=MMETSP0372-20130328/2005_1 /TAXON_ID=340204 /ORGANISM="Lankesteria abbotti" /LENGTH=139 /DNA_ID=CAMNT_0000816977 /DNA_START=471 /DNA_END=890 /DNA_ORIENTATION=- /assembly_acc=CAM_ASM_000359